MSDGRCPELFELEQHASGSAAGDLSSRVESHASSCLDCASVLQDLRADLSLASRVQRVFGDGGGATRGLPAIEGYRLLGELGRGGMGVVYEAEQLSPPRTVALKVVRGAQFVDQDTLRLFQREIRVLARLSHPGIAALYDAGCTAGGEHYFAMELVRGTSLSKRAQELDRRARLELFRQLCEAIDFAHQRGVVHRDLKPSNVLVTAEGRIKVLDFGLAKITDQDVSQTSLHSEPGQIRGTLAYMSPEQARGDPAAIDLCSDVYSLGVVLYELLTGKLPTDVFQVHIHEAARRICEEKPRRPSAHDPSLRGDLETIVLKALEKEPARRYGSAASLAEDVRRFLDDEVLLARPPSALYELSKLVRRHTLPFVLAAAIFVLALGTAIWTGALYGRESELRLESERKTVAADQARAAETVAKESAQRAEAAALAQAQRADEEAQRARREAETYLRVKDFMLGVFGARSFERRTARQVSAEELLQRGIERIRGELVDDKRVRAALLSGLGEVCRGLHMNAQAEPLLVEAAGILRAEAPRSQELATALSNLGLLREQQHDPHTAVALQEEALALFESAGAAGSRNALSARGNLAEALYAAGELAHAVQLFRECLEERDARGSEEYANQQVNLGQALYDLGQYDEGERVLGEAISALQPRGSSLRLANAYNALGMIRYGRRDPDGAEQSLSESLRLKIELLEPESELFASAYNNLAGVRNQRGDARGALEYLELARGILARNNAEGSAALAMNDHNRARALLKLGELDRAAELAEAALAWRRASLGGQHAALADTLVLRSEIHLLRRELPQAEAALREALPIYDARLGRANITTVNARFRLGQIRQAAQDWPGAEGPTLEALEDLRRVPGDQSGARAAIRQQLAAIYTGWGKPDEAAQYAAAPAKQ